MRAIELICNGKCIRACDALKFKLIDEVVDFSLLAAAIAHARRLIGHKRRIRDESVLIEDAVLIDVAEQ